MVFWHFMIDADIADGGAATGEVMQKIRSCKNRPIEIEN